MYNLYLYFVDVFTHLSYCIVEDLQCLWTECGHEIGDDFLELMRHVYFHAFHTKIKSIGQTFAEVQIRFKTGLSISATNRPFGQEFLLIWAATFSA